MNTFRRTILLSILALMPLNCIFWCISFGRHFITWPVIWKEINGRWKWGIFFSSLFLFFYECRRRYSRGSDFTDLGAAFSFQLCISVAEPLLLKCNHSNLLLWFPIERISSLVFPRVKSLALCSYCLVFPILCRVPAKCWCWLSILHVVGILLF